MIRRSAVPFLRDSDLTPFQLYGYDVSDGQDR